LLAWSLFSCGSKAEIRNLLLVEITEHSSTRAMPMYVNPFINSGGVLPPPGFQNLFRRPCGHWHRNSTSA
jgi:hypothetical protein